MELGNSLSMNCNSKFENHVFFINMMNAYFMKFLVVMIGAFQNIKLIFFSSSYKFYNQMMMH